MGSEIKACGHVVTNGLDGQARAKIQAGDVVQMKSGGPKMVAIEGDDSGFDCAWVDHGQNKRHEFFPIHALRMVDEKPILRLHLEEPPDDELPEINTPKPGSETVHTQFRINPIGSAPPGDPADEFLSAVIGIAASPKPFVTIDARQRLHRAIEAELRRREGKVPA